MVDTLFNHHLTPSVTSNTLCLTASRAKMLPCKLKSVSALINQVPYWPHPYCKSRQHYLWLWASCCYNLQHFSTCNITLLLDKLQGNVIRFTSPLSSFVSLFLFRRPISFWYCSVAVSIRLFVEVMLLGSNYNIFSNVTTGNFLYEDMIDHRSYIHQLKQKLKPKKIEPLISQFLKLCVTAIINNVFIRSSNVWYFMYSLETHTLFPK